MDMDKAQKIEKLEQMMEDLKLIKIPAQEKLKEFLIRRQGIQKEIDLLEILIDNLKISYENIDEAMCNLTDSNESYVTWEWE